MLGCISVIEVERLVYCALSRAVDCVCCLCSLGRNPKLHHRISYMQEWYVLD